MDQEASFTFTTPLNVNIVNIKGVERTFVEGDISTNDIDFVNDIMSKKCQVSMQKQILERNMKLDIEHEAFKGKTTEEKEIAKTKIPAGKLIDAVVKELGNKRWSTRVKAEINRNRADYKSIQGNLVDEYLDAFSVAFLATKIMYQTIEGKDIPFGEYAALPHEERRRILDDCILLNVALTGNACNTKAQIAKVVVKSMDALEDYKARKELDPSIEDQLIVKHKPDKKENPLSFIWNKIYSGKQLEKNELKLLKAALDVTSNKGTEAILAKEYYTKLANGEKLTNKEYWTFKELTQIDYPESEYPMADTIKSHSSNKIGDLTKLHIKNSNKMTDKTESEIAAEAEAAKAAEAAAEGSDDVDKKSVEMLKSISLELKSMNEAYEVVAKDNVALKETQSEMTKELAKITEALKQPIHKSMNVNKKEEEEAAADAAAANLKSVDPLDLC